MALLRIVHSFHVVVVSILTPLQGSQPEAIWIPLVQAHVTSTLVSQINVIVYECIGTHLMSLCFLYRGFYFN